MVFSKASYRGPAATAKRRETAANFVTAEHYTSDVPTVAFTPNLRRHLDCPEVVVPPGTVCEALERVFAENPRLRSYIVDEQGRLRQHVAVFVGGELVRDRLHLSDRVGDDQDVFVMQALSGG
jgi:hypothetical protein